MAKVLMTDPATGRVAFFEENGTSGDPFDPNSAINAPLNNPFDYFGSIPLHSDADMFEVDVSGATTVTHSAVSAISAPDGFSVAYGADAGGDDHLLVTHGLGYSPLAMVAIGGNVLWPGMPVQTLSDGSGGARYATAYVDDNDLRVATLATIGSTTLASDSIAYEYLVLKAVPSPIGDILFEWDPATGVLDFGLGKVSTDRSYLQVVSGGSPFAILFGETIDVSNGAPKAWNPDGSTYAPVPTGLKPYLILHAYDTTYAPVLGASMAYNGTAAGPAAAVLVQAP